LHTNAERNHSIGLLPNIQELLTSLGLKAKNLKAIAVGNGPGSYTGVRIGVTVGKTFAWSLGLDLVGVSSLEAMALGGRRRWVSEPTTDQHVQETGQAHDASIWIIPLMDARRTQAFTAVYAARGSWGAEELLAAFGKENEQLPADASLKTENPLWRSLVPDGIYLIQPWLEQLGQMAVDAAYLESVTGVTGLRAPERLIFVGETAGFENALVAFQEQCGIAVHIVPHLMDAYDIGLLGHLKLAAGNLTDVHTFVPNYTQLPEAEVKLLAKSQKGED
jgi:tRNA threonylcarbamoyladenosine biosynthesis protein TsaB